MQSIYPIFELNRVLKKEALTALRDYSCDYAQLTYQDYAVGILVGCSLTVFDNKLEISPGILKYNGRILLLPEPERVPYVAANCLQYLKARITADDTSPEFVAYSVIFILEQTKECKENEMELCRFHLRQGAELRDRYKDFFDLETEYDTINPIFSAWGGKGGKTLSSFITQLFAKEILQTPGKRAEDINFAYACLNQSTGMAYPILKHYVNSWKPGIGREKETNVELFKGLCEILKAAQSGKLRAETTTKERKKILID